MKTLSLMLRHLVPYYIGLWVGAVCWGNVSFKYSSSITLLLAIVAGLLIGYNFSKEGA
jgi:hypothetical protein